MSISQPAGGRPVYEIRANVDHVGQEYHSFKYERVKRSCLKDGEMLLTG